MISNPHQEAEIAREHGHRITISLDFNARLEYMWPEQFLAIYSFLMGSSHPYALGDEDRSATIIEFIESFAFRIAEGVVSESDDISNVLPLKHLEYYLNFTNAILAGKSKHDDSLLLNIAETIAERKTKEAAANKKKNQDDRLDPS